MNSDVKGVTANDEFIQKRVEYSEENSYFDEEADQQDTLLVTMLASLDQNIQNIKSKELLFGMIMFNSEVEVITGDL